MSDVLTPVVDTDEDDYDLDHEPSKGQKFWAWIWPKAMAIVIVLAAWELVVLTGWRPRYILPGPLDSLGALWEMMNEARFWQAILTTLTRAVVGFSVALAIGTIIGILVSRVRVLRLAVGSLITGLQTMPSIAWFPLAILLFQLTERAILFVVILGAAPSIANGVIAGIDQVPPAYRRLGKVLGANGFALYRHIILPAALPSYVSGLTQGWAFAWRSLMAGELLVIIASRPSLGSTLDFARQFNRADELLATMLVILILGMLVDGIFSYFARSIRHKRGLAIDD